MNDDFPKMINLIRDIKSNCQFDLQIGMNYNIGQSELVCLNCFSRNKLLKQGELAKLMKLSSSRASRIAASLVKKGFLSSTQCDCDKRVFHFSLSESGKGVLKSIKLEESKCEDNFIKKLGKQRAKESREMLKEILAIL